MEKILLLTGNFAEDYETIPPFPVLLRARHETQLLYPPSKKGDYVKAAVHFFEGDKNVTKKPYTIFS